MVCKTEKEEKVYIEVYVSSFNNQEYKLYHCESCDLQWWEPLKIVPEFYEQEGDEDYAIMRMGLYKDLIRTQTW